MIPGEFDYYAPGTVQEAVALLQQHGHDAKLLAGGHSLVPSMRFRLSLPEVLIDLNGISDLAYIRQSNGHLAIGAMTREVELEESAVVRDQFPMLYDATRVVADPLVRNRATLGGNLAHADPANDHPAVILAYDAQMVAVGPQGQRVIAADDFFVDLFDCALTDDEILTEIRITAQPSNSGEAYIKVERKVGDYATSAVAAAIRVSGNTCISARIALTNVSHVPMRAHNAEAALTGQELTDEVLETAGQAAAAECEPTADLRGSVEYKRDLTRILTKRAVRKAMERAGS